MYLSGGNFWKSSVQPGCQSDSYVRLYTGSSFHVFDPVGFLRPFGIVESIQGAEIPGHSADAFKSHILAGIPHHAKYLAVRMMSS